MFICSPNLIVYTRNFHFIYAAHQLNSSSANQLNVMLGIEMQKRLVIAVK